MSAGEEILFHHWLLDRMKTVGISQTELINALKSRGFTVGHASCSRWVHGRAYPPRKVFGAVLDSLAVHGKARNRAARLYSGIKP